MNRTILIACIAILLLPSCTVYTEKQSEVLSQSAYLADDSFEAGRFDVTDSALDNVIRIVKPPKQRLQIKAIETPTSLTSSSEGSTQKNTNTAANQKIVIVPEKFKNQQIVVVNSEEFQQLIKDKKILEQLQGDHKILNKLKVDIEQELAKQIAYNNKMVEDLNKLQKELLSKKLLILKLYIIIAIMVLVMGGGVYLRLKGIL
jgi:hypothetical protein